MTVSSGVFAKNNPKTKVINITLIKAHTYRTSCDGVTFTYSANSNQEAVQIALRYCKGGTIQILD
jgi:hypothetical protein